LTDFRKVFIKFHENPFIASRIVPVGRTERQTDVTKLAVFSEICELTWKVYFEWFQYYY